MRALFFITGATVFAALIGLGIRKFFEVTTTVTEEEGIEE